jgi:uncharacterized damage-inducible protein DinB
MTERVLWFSRKFSFDLEAWTYPNIVERLRGTPARIEERLRSVDKATLTRRVGDAWSIQENAGHLYDLEGLWSLRLDDFERGAERLSAADLQNRKTHDANHNSTPLADVLAKFRAARELNVRRLEAYDDRFILRTSLHPRLEQPMRVIDLMFFVAEHDDHHLATISQLLRTTA